nr:crosslink repair DNA glycosylase YcaQ family protein [uncultured Sphingomonas sp.]
MDVGAHRALIEQAPRTDGIATSGDLRDRFRLSPAVAHPAIQALAEESVLIPVYVPGWRHAWRHRDARRIEACALLSPFDPMIWIRDRTERLFGFHYRIGIYVPAERCRHDDHVLPFLLGERLVDRVDRKAGLLIQSTHLEPGASDHTRAASRGAWRRGGLAGACGQRALSPWPISRGTEYAAACHRPAGRLDARAARQAHHDQAPVGVTGSSAWVGRLPHRA